MSKRLYKIEEGKMVAGVCGGLAEYFNIDPTVVRIAWLLFLFVFGTGVLAYLIAAIVLPKKSAIQ